MHTHAVRLIDRLNPRTCFLGEGPAIHSQARRRWPLRRPQIQSRVRSLTLSRHLRFFAYNLEAKTAICGVPTKMDFKIGTLASRREASSDGSLNA